MGRVPSSVFSSLQLSPAILRAVTALTRGQKWRLSMAKAKKGEDVSPLACCALYTRCVINIQTIL